jgi:hypothetical protein
VNIVPAKLRDRDAWPHPRYRPFWGFFTVSPYGFRGYFTWFRSVTLGCWVIGIRWRGMHWIKLRSPKEPA